MTTMSFVASTMSATQICSVDESDGHLRLDRDALDRLLSGQEEKKLIVVSCVGALRGGKSTFLSWLVRRALFHRRSFQSSVETHQREEDEPKGSDRVFPTAWGRTPCTSGIWAQVIERDEDTSWLFLDTQGMFDGRLDVTATSHLFGVSVKQPLDIR